MSDEDCVCAKCHEDYYLRENCEPSKYCDRCVHDVVATLEASLAAATAREGKLERECEAWRALATESSGSARSLDFSLQETGSHGAEIVSYPGYGHVVATDAVYHADSFQAAAIGLATRLGLTTNKKTE